MPTILLIEDSPESVALTRGAFSGCPVKAELEVVRNGEEALEWLSGTGRYEGRDPARRPELVLMDIRLPGMSGFEALERIRAERLTSMVPVVMLTVSELKSDIETAYRLGANSFLVKPLDYEEYTRMIRAACEYWISFNRRPYA
ncbi:MAG: response regulator [Deltaproteobacteria bacterium]|nr:response regulator [Deltaproteobacteria bacterium]MBZ0220141.1 response regulator [Deltaproteobacteria bacterium]